MVVAYRSIESPMMRFVVQLGALLDDPMPVQWQTSNYPSFQTCHVSVGMYVPPVAMLERTTSGPAGIRGVFVREPIDPSMGSMTWFRAIQMIRGGLTIQSCCSICGVGLVDSVSFWFSPLINANIRFNPANAISS